MPVFDYKGVDGGSKAVKGIVDAESIKSARLKLKAKGIYPTELKEKSTKQQKGKKAPLLGGGVKMKNLTMMTRQLATLIKAHIPLDEALGALVEQTEDPRLKSIMSQVRESVNEGHALAESVRQYPRIFSPIFIAMIQVGEASGNLDLVLVRLADFAEAQYELRNKVFGAMAYPAFMAVAGCGITIFLFAFAVPKITEVFAGSKVPLPTLTVIMITISDFMAKNWPFIIGGVFGTFFFFKWYTSTKNGREWWDSISLKIPLYGKMRRMIAVSRFSRTMSTMIGSGVQVLDAIDIVKDVVDNTVIRRALIRVRESISEGKSIAGPLKESGEFPPMLTHMIAVGEKTGDLEEMLNIVSDSYDSQLDNTINSMTRLLEPLMILIMGGIIALVALSIFMPMLQLNDLSSAG